jgi:tetratricopeptide (TPR) repeat protein
MKIISKFAGIMILSAITVTSLGAQDRNDVIKVYNEGAKLMQTDIPAAIKAFEEVVTLSDKVGETAADLRLKAVQVLPGLYAKIASNTIKEKKPVPEIMQTAKTAAAAAEKYGNDAGRENASKIMVQAYNAMATNYFTQKDYEKALLAFDTVLSINPGYLNAIYNKALIYKAQNNSDAFEETIDLFIEKLKSGNDAERVKQASIMALEYFRAAGSKANQAEKLDEALALLNKAAKYGDDKSLFYFFADVYNKQKKFDSGAEYAQKGLALETGDAEAKAKFYFQLALAQAGREQTADACISFKNAMYGPFAEASKVQRKNLKCE